MALQTVFRPNEVITGTRLTRSVSGRSSREQPHNTGSNDNTILFSRAVPCLKFKLYEQEQQQQQYGMVLRVRVPNYVICTRIYKHMAIYRILWEV